MTAVDTPRRRPDTRSKMELTLAALWELPSNGKAVTGSLRDIQKLTGLGRGTVAAALRRMTDDGWVTPTGNARKSTDWRAANSFCLQRQPIAPPCFLMSRLGLGTTSLLLWTVTAEHEWLSTAELAQRSEVSNRTARKYLLRLHSAGLVDRCEGKWLRIGTEKDIAAAEVILIGSDKRIFRRYIIDQQVEWKQTTDRIRDRRSQGGHSGNG